MRTEGPIRSDSGAPGKKCWKGLVKARQAMYKPAQIPKLMHVYFGRLAGRGYVSSANWSNENGCTEEKNEPVQARYAPLG